MVSVPPFLHLLKEKWHGVKQIVDETHGQKDSTWIQQAHKHAGDKMIRVGHGLL